jgi:hypothetical protein
MIMHRMVVSLFPFVYAAFLWMQATQTAQAAPNLISYQGRLTDSSGVAVPDSSYGVVFGIYADSIGETSLWEESATITARDGLFSHRLGSVTSLPQSIFQDNDRLYLQITVGVETVVPRTRLSSVPYARTAANLSVTDTGGTPAIKTYADSHQVSIFGYGGDATLVLRGGIVGDEAMVLPDASINSIEMLDEPGIAVETNSSLIPLPTDVMTDLVTVEITIPTDGYVLLHGKCYVLLSGTTGPNSAIVQIDENEGGNSQFPYYTQAGLGGYVNTSTNYFPAYATRTYYKAAGSYTFRMEGQASNPLPAEAKTWDHILTAVFYPTSYEGVKQISSEPGDHPEAVPIIIEESTNPGRSGIYYEMDLRYFEWQAKGARNSQKAKDSQSDD